MWVICFWYPVVTRMIRDRQVGENKRNSCTLWLEYPLTFFGGVFVSLSLSCEMIHCTLFPWWWRGTWRLKRPSSSPKRVLLLHITTKKDKGMREIKERTTHAALSYLDNCTSINNPTFFFFFLSFKSFPHWWRIWKRLIMYDGLWKKIKIKIIKLIEKPSSAFLSFVRKWQTFPKKFTRICLFLVWLISIID